AGELNCPSKNPVLTIRVKKAPAKNPSVEMMALNAEDAISSKPQYKLLKKETGKLDGHKAIFLTMTFNNLGNVTLPVQVRTVSVALEHMSLELEAACNQSNCKELIPAFEEAIQSLHVADKGQKLKESSDSGGLPGFGSF
ncbi:MAG: hypothetical protein JKY15_00390, partial [Deltaproteobacteria bacterium]|nr:hypothetical protein [Deltaproteobacteria bacterium]